MEVCYKRNLNSNYMILKGQSTGESYEVRMVTENRINGFLPCVSQKCEGGTEYYYEITGRQSMALLYERRKMGCGELRELLRGLEQILEAAGEYLLDPGHLILDPEYMYLNSRTEKLCLCYYPENEKTVRESFLDLAEYLLGKLDKSDTEGIEFGYDLYQNALEPNFSLLEVLCRHAEPKPKPVAVPNPEPIMEDPIEVKEEILKKTGSWKNFFHRKQKKPKLADYVAEADQMGSGSILFLREGEPQKETACLEPYRQEGLILKSRDPEYPDFHVAGECFVIGKRKESVDGCIPASTVSRLHARITFDGSRYYLEDLNSTNGTWVDQLQLNPYEPYALEHGMHLMFASAEYDVKL